MPFIGTYKGAMQMLGWIESGRCKAGCRSGWLQNFKYALKTPTNPLKLTATQRKTMKARMDGLKGRRAPAAKTLKLSRYRDRPSPPYPANENCGKTMKGNDRLLYKSIANSAGVCSWRKQ